MTDKYVQLKNIFRAFIAPSSQIQKETMAKLFVRQWNLCSGIRLNMADEVLWCRKNDSQR